MENVGMMTPYLRKFPSETDVVYFGGLCTKVGREVDQQTSHTIELGNSIVQHNQNSISRNRVLQTTTAQTNPPPNIVANFILNIVTLSIQWDRQTRSLKGPLMLIRTG